MDPLIAVLKQDDQAFAMLLENLWVTNYSEFLSTKAVLDKLPEDYCKNVRLSFMGANSFLQSKAANDLGFQSDKERRDSERKWECCDVIEAELHNVNLFRDPSLIEAEPIDNAVPRRALLAPNPVPPVREQGDYSSCVAQALLTAVEYCEGVLWDEASRDDFFQQCQARGGQIGDGAVLQVALALAGNRSWCDARIVDPGQIGEWKRALAHSPIVATFMLFPTTFYSKAARATGKFFCPLPNEPTVDMHAMVVVGYQDDPNVPGGGYYIAQNSWGETYAAQSPIGRPGFSLIPYRYVQCWCSEAFLIEPFATPRNVGTDDRYLRVLDKEIRVNGQLLYPGAEVVCHPDQPDVARKYSEETLREFKEKGFAWTREQRVRNYFPVSNEIFAANATECANASKYFFNGLSANLGQLIGTPSPFSKNIWGAPRLFSEVKELADLSPSVRERVAIQKGLYDEPDGNSLINSAPDDYKKTLDATATVKIWGVDDGKKTVIVAGVFLAPLQFSPERQPVFQPPTGADIQVALDAIEEWMKEKSNASPFEGVLYAFGSRDGDWNELNLRMPSGVPYSFSKYQNRENDRWQTDFCGSVNDDRLRELLKILRPATLDETVRKIRDVLEYARKVCFGGDLTVKYIAEETKLPINRVEKALEELVKNGEYECYLTSRDDNAYRKKG